MHTCIMPSLHRGWMRLPLKTTIQVIQRTSSWWIEITVLLSSAPGKYNVMIGNGARPVDLYLDLDL